MHPDRPHYDVVVVGARPAGAATAMLLARAGLRVLVVDRSRYGADTLSTHALLRGGVLQLHRWGLLDRLVEAGTPAVRRTTFRYHDEEVVIAIKPSHGVDALVRAAADDPRPAARRRGRGGRGRGPLRRHRRRPALRSPGARRGHRRSRRRRPAAGRRRGARGRGRRAPLDRRPPRRRAAAADGQRRQRRRLRLLGRRRHRRLRVDLPSGRLRRRHPDQRRAGLRLRRGHAGPHRARRPSRPRGRARTGGSRRRGPGAGRHRAVRRPHLQGPSRPRAAGVGAGVGPRRRCRLLEGSPRRPRADRGAPRRRAAGPRDHLDGDHRRAGARRPGPLPVHPGPPVAADVRRHGRHRRPTVVRARDRRTAPADQRARWPTRSTPSPRSTRCRSASASAATPPPPDRGRPGSGRARAGTPATPGRARAAGGCSCRAGAAGSPG